jgi:hypothetical protein
VTRYNQTARTPLINRAYAAANDGEDADELREILAKLWKRSRKIERELRSLECAKEWTRRRIMEIENGNEVG